MFEKNGECSENKRTKVRRVYPFQNDLKSGLNFNVAIMKCVTLIELATTVLFLRNCVTQNERNRATLFPKTPKLSDTFHFECLVAITNLVFVLL